MKRVNMRMFVRATLFPVVVFFLPLTLSHLRTYCLSLSLPDVSDQCSSFRLCQRQIEENSLSPLRMIRVKPEILRNSW
jgi:hypothetical protein